MATPHCGGSTRSCKHVEGSSKSRGSGGELMSTLDTGEGSSNCLRSSSLHWSSWWCVVVGGGINGLACLNDFPAGVFGDTGGHPDLGSTTAESLVADGLSSLSESWSAGTEREGFLTSGTCGSSSWDCHILEQLFNGCEIVSSFLEVVGESLSVGIVGLNLAVSNSEVKSGLGSGNIGVKIAERISLIGEFVILLVEVRSCRSDGLSESGDSGSFNGIIEVLE